MKGDLLTQSEKTDVKIALRSKDLSAHYRKARVTYQNWATSTCGTRIKGMNGKPDHTFNLPESVEQLTITIRNYDSELKLLLANKKTQEEIGNMTHLQVCRLFAMYVLAGEPSL